MERSPNNTTVLDVSKGLGYGFLYHPVIGASRSKKTYPFVVSFPRLRPKKIKKRL